MYLYIYIYSLPPKFHVKRLKTPGAGGFLLRMKLSESDVTETPFSDLTTDPGETDVEGDLEQTYLGSQLRQVTALI